MKRSPLTLAELRERKGPNWLRGLAVERRKPSRQRHHAGRRTPIPELPAEPFPEAPGKVPGLLDHFQPDAIETRIAEYLQRRAA